MYWQIAIDGPAGAGKSTIAKAVAKILHCEYIDTGAMYRAVTLKGLQLAVNLEDETAYKFLDETIIDFQDGEIFLDHKNVSKEIRSLEVTNNVSLVSKFKYVRDRLVVLQRQMSKSKTIIMDGRDIGTVVLPNAHLKIFLNASVEERARRRLKERLESSSITSSLEETIEEIKIRDEKDSTRAISPLKKADDAIEIDTSNLSISEVIEKIISLVMERGYKMENVKTEKEMTVESVATSTNEVEEVKTTKAQKAPKEELVSETETVEAKKAKAQKAPKEELVSETETVEAKKAKAKKAPKEELVSETETVEAKQAKAQKASKEELVSETESVEAKVDAENPQEELEAKDEFVLKELSLVEGLIVDIEEAKKEIIKEGEVVRSAKQERLVIRLKNGQEGLLFRRDMVDVSDDEDLADIFMLDEPITVVVKKVYPDGGKVLLSQVLVKKREEITKFEDMIKEHGTFMAKVLRKIKVGLVLEYDGFPCLLPKSQIHIKDEEELNALVGTEILVAPIRVDYNRIRLLVSATVANAIVNRKDKEKALETIKVGDVFKGVVKNIESYGAFVEIVNGIEGLLHISEVDHSRIVKVEKVLSIGDEVDVKVIKLDGFHIGLSRKALLPNYWQEFVESKKVGDLVTGNVIEINRAGVVVDLVDKVQAFLPRSEFSWERDAYIDDYIKVGDEISLKIIELDPSKKRIILSRKQTMPNPWTELQLKSGDNINVVVEKVLAEGVKIHYEGASGFLPKGNITPGVEINEGEELEVRVRVFDAERTRLLVTMKEDNYIDRHQVNRYLKSQDKVSHTLGDFIDFDQFKGKKGKK